MNKPRPRSWLCLVRALVLLLAAHTLCYSAAAAEQTQSSSPSSLEEEYQQVITAAFRQMAKAQSDTYRRDTSVDRLAGKVQQALSDLDLTGAVSRVVANETLIIANMDHEQLPFLIETLLKAHATELAENFLQAALSNASNFGLARVRLVFARHHAARGEWRGAIDQLERIDIANDLPPSEGDEAYISYGVALQGLKEHRKAIEFYGRVKPDSPHYPVAQLNRALAFIRQDWWTDAQLAIANALDAVSNRDQTLADRLHTVMGFMQIQYGFYRDARESFRNVRSESPHANRALLGLGIAALHQQDLAGALNAFDHLKARNPDDISTIESYLLSAYALDRLGQKQSALSGYTEAMAFYQRYTAACDSLSSRLEKRDSMEQLEAILQEVLKKVSAAERRELEAIREKASLVRALAQQLVPETAGQLSVLHQQLERALGDLSLIALRERKEVIGSYLSQARFGLAKLHDTP